MASLIVRRASVASLVLALVVSGVAFADTVSADGNSVAADNQTGVDLGSMVTGTTRSFDLDFVLACKNGAHLAAGTEVNVVDAGVFSPDDGSATVDPGQVSVPSAWPAPGEPCDASDTPVRSDVPAHLVITAPTVAGVDRHYDFLFAVDPDDGSVSNAIAFTITVDVVEPAPQDTTDPVLSGVPGSLTVFTSGTSAVVDYDTPTATDDTDASPTVVCEPPSGATFDLGTTTVTCTATDDAGNDAEASFEVTVVQMFATWGRPLEDAVPALTGHAGRTIPLKLDVTAGGATQGPSDIDAPTLRVAPLAACAADAAAGRASGAGTFAWNDGTWQLNLDTTGLAAGCWRLSATLDGAALATAVVRLDGGEGTAAKRLR